MNSRTYSSFSNRQVESLLNDLINTRGVEHYRDAMMQLGSHLGVVLNDKIPNGDSCIIASTAEDADYLSKGVIDTLRNDHDIFAAVFWNNHYSLNDGGSVAPILNRYLQPGYERSKHLIVVKSVISGSCVVRTNILALIDKIQPETIYVVSPVMHAKSENSLRSEFPSEIANKFEFVSFAVDQIKDETGEVKPGIGGQVYGLLGFGDQPVKIGYMPKLVRDLVLSA